REREFDNLKQGNLRVDEYARQFSSLLSYVPHVANQERTKRNNFLRGLKPELFRMVLVGSPATYAEAVDRAVDIEESLMEVHNQVQPIAGRSFQPVPKTCLLSNLLKCRNIRIVRGLSLEGNTLRSDRTRVLLF
ncbi:hypothetical protein F511_20946, partial [Dorcoceras hygrometricum]